MSSTACVPLTLVRSKSGGSPIIYKRHEELGRGGFASVYRITNQSTGEEFALKAIPKERVAKPKALEKLKSEIAIQSRLNHPNILRAYDSFEDDRNYYIVTELCPGKSIRDMVKKNIRLSETETIRILKDILEGLSYLHDNRVIHRDLKLENFLVGADNRVKIGDFGLSAQLDHDDERKFTVCGTPNYLSPEVLSSGSKGHSYEVDIWAIGVCAYAMLVGRPPFETRNTKITYEHIKTCRYDFPVTINLSPASKDFIQTTLQIKPELRPSVQELFLHPFICGQKYHRPSTAAAVLGAVEPRRVEIPPPRGYKHRVESARRDYRDENREHNRVEHLRHEIIPNNGEMSMPKHCVARFCDHSERYGLGYLLIDGTIGACFNDLSRMAMDPFEEFIHYWPNYQTASPEVLRPDNMVEAKKIAIIKKFSDALKKTKSMYDMPSTRPDQNVPMRHVKYWMRNEEATLFRMDDRDIQVNFNDRTKVIIFWNSKKLMMVKSIKELGRPVGLTELGASSTMLEEKRRFAIAKAMLAEMSGR